MTVMCQRLRVKEMVVQMHDKNLMLMNILRDIAENETSGDFERDATEEEIARWISDRAVRRAEILGEIRHVLLQDDLARRVQV